ncbi:cell division protein ZapE [Iodobacter fluviatilis]|uniref:Cell division protein ZapE n=1 Tax=Iodobacter fluviatilis TaxID=537 RepID=A0A7G3G5Q6_9NEIS|nr:cell division protein ZapE [Iodobacter fluviatilis]QBC42448.1 cell division protein ZapE [Iodobacter fluviatilis]
MSLHHIVPPTQGTSPKAWYQGLSARPGFISDPAQAEAIDRLDALYHQLIFFKTKRSRLFGKSLLPQPDLPRGLYFWGGVGRGKSFLMDAFYAALPYKRKKRLHFHQFMQEVHHELRQLKGESDPLAAVATKIAKSVRVLCFDEFHVSDIADAMILGRLMEHLFKRGVVLVTTSNYPPDGLYPNGLQRSHFLPTIALLNNTLDVFNLDGGNDYRMRTLTQARTYLSPHTADSVSELDALFSAMATSKDSAPQLKIEGRTIKAKRVAAGVVWFDFFAICGDARGQADYLQIAHSYHTVMVSDIPRLAGHQAAEARRFTWLVDVFYDHRVKLIISAEVSVDLLYQAGVQASEFFRTTSRLTEMQTEEYLALPHQSIEVQLTGIAET